MLSSFSTTSSYTQALGQGKGIHETSNSKTVPPMEGGSERINCNLIRAATLPAPEHITSCSISSLAAGRVPAALAGALLGELHGRGDPRTLRAHFTEGKAEHKGGVVYPGNTGPLKDTEACWAHPLTHHRNRLSSEVLSGRK